GKVDDVAPPGAGAGAAAVFVPEHDAALGEGAEQVRSAVTVEVAGPNRARLRQVEIDGMHLPLGVSGATRVAKPDELVPQPPARSRHVEPAVAVDVREVDVVGAEQPALRNRVAAPRPPVLRAPGVLG